MPSSSLPGQRLDLNKSINTKWLSETYVLVYFRVALLAFEIGFQPSLHMLCEGLLKTNTDKALSNFILHILRSCT